MTLDGAKNRRQLIQCTGLALLLPGAALSQAGLPIKNQPSPIDDLIPRLVNAIYTGVVNRQVAIPASLAENLFDRNANVDLKKMMLIPAENSTSSGDLQFIEIRSARPIYVRSVAKLPLYSGKIYCKGFLNSEQRKVIDDLIGKKCIFLIDSFAKNGVQKESFPFPLYHQASDGNWREALPLPISRLSEVIKIADRLGFKKTSS